PRAPRSFTEGDPNVARLFPDFPSVEADYFRRTGIFPIMHVVVIRRDVYERNRWVARSLYNAFEESRRRTMAAIDETAALPYMLPWLGQEVARTREIMGSDYWSYGLDKNQETLNQFVIYAYDQGITSQLSAPQQLFAAEATDAVIV